MVVFSAAQPMPFVTTGVCIAEPLGEQKPSIMGLGIILEAVRYLHFLVPPPATTFRLAYVSCTGFQTHGLGERWILRVRDYFPYQIDYIRKATLALLETTAHLTTGHCLSLEIDTSTHGGSLWQKALNSACFVLNMNPHLATVTIRSAECDRYLSFNPPCFRIEHKLEDVSTSNGTDSEPQDSSTKDGAASAQRPPCINWE